MTDHTLHSLAPITQDQLPPGSLVICATVRLAQTLALAHDIAANQSISWQTLQSTTFQQWLHGLHDAMALRGQEPPDLDGVRVLDAFQERLVWEQVIHEQLDRSAAPLFDVGALAATAAEAHALIINWHVRIDHGFGAAFASEEQNAFRRWRTHFLDRCREQRLIDGASLNSLLINHLAEHDGVLPAHIVFAGFDHYTPLEQRLQAALHARGCQLYTLITNAACQMTPQIHQAANMTDECLAAAIWAKNMLQSNPQSRIGIVAPDLAAYQHALTDALEDVIDPTFVLARHAGQRRPFNISLGQPLSSLPVVRTALTLLQVLIQQHAVEQPLISELLHSPYWSTSDESDARARLDASIRDSVSPKATLRRYDRFAHVLFEKQSLSAPHTRGYFHALSSASQGLSNTSRLPSAWRKAIQASLGQCGWLAEGHLRSTEFQAREAFAKELGRLAQLDQITGKITFSRAVSLLSQLCSERLFQPKTRGTPPIQILGVLEAAGLDFDAVWIMGLTDAVWPPAAKPNPLLSAEAQRAAGSPNASATVQLDFARRIQQRLLHSAGELCLSYPLRDEATELQPSPLIRDMGQATLLDSVKPPWASTIQTTGGSLEAIDDAQAPRVPEGDKVGGGTWLLRAQAICPAWGFYQYRLGAKALAEPVEGLDPRKRGTLVHDTLETFWKTTGSLAALQAMSDAERRAAITQAATTALERFNADQKQEALKPRQTLLEHKRLVRLTDEWLQLEATRKEAFTVLETEGKREVSIEGIVAHMRIDRIDQLDDGRTIIIDYKTGASIDTKNWANDRITEPQLPIYAAIAGRQTNLAQQPVAGVAFAVVHLSGLGFKGIGQNDGLLPNVHAVTSDRGRRLFDTTRFPDWQSVLQHWHDAIHNVAREIGEGDASVRITSPNDIKYCDVLPLLRIAERQQQLDHAMHQALHTEHEA